ncbi:MAG: phosphomannomutase/phosphoglucomutase [Bacteroidales bacterium]|nr:phosphomannomutase/phosphoglucomutase [Bacteroidales bacterium]
MKAFHAYDIRGIYNQDFNKDDAYKIGYFIPELLKTNKVLVGRDVRISSPEIFKHLCKGINDAGADVYDLGLSTTPMVYFITAKHGFDASVMITASHNSKEYNGMKISRTDAIPVGYDTGLNKLEEMLETKEVKIKEKRGSVISYNQKNEYIDFLKKYIPDLSQLKIAVDCSNGMAALLIKELLGDTPEYIFDELDGTFPNHEANPLVPKNIVDLQNLVKKEKADIGIIFDGDADRVMFTDENGKFISPDLMIAVLADYFKDEKGKFLQDIRTSKAVAEYIGNRFEMNMWKVGRAYAALKLREIDGVFGGELAGHYYFRDFYYSDSGLLATLILLNVITDNKKNGIKVSEMISKIEAYKNSGEINFKLEKKKEAMEAVKDFYFQLSEEPAAFYDFDGYRVEYNDWWFNIRPSNTEPYLRMLVEAKSKELLDEKVKEITEIIKSFD